MTGGHDETERAWQAMAAQVRMVLDMKRGWRPCPKPFGKRRHPMNRTYLDDALQRISPRVWEEDCD